MINKKNKKKQRSPSRWESKENHLGYTTVSREIKESIGTDEEGGLFLTFVSLKGK